MAAMQGSGETRSCASQGVVAPAAPAGDQLPVPTPCQPHGCSCQPRTCSHSTLDTQLRVLAPSWCQGALGVMSGHPETGMDLGHCMQEMVSWKSRSCSRLPRWKKPPWLAGKGVAGSGQPQFILTLWNSQFC